MKYKPDQIAQIQALAQNVEDRYRTACRELARLGAKSQTDYSDELETAMVPHAVNRLESRGQLLAMGYTLVQITAIELAERTRGQIQAARENGVD